MTTLFVRPMLLRIGTLLLFAGRLSSDVLGADPDKSLQAGAVAQDITPLEFPISVNGNMADVQATGAHDRLHARCLVLANGETSLAIVVCDSCMIPRDLIDAARQQASAKTGIPAANFLISATHAHSCPTVTGVFQSDPDQKYSQFLITQIADGIDLAYRQRVPARIGWGVVDEPSQLFNRRWVAKDGETFEDPFGGRTDRVKMNPGYSNPLVDRPVGAVDPQVSILSVQTRDGRPLALLANYSLHYVGGVSGAVVSADYFGEFATRMARQVQAGNAGPSFVGIMSNGTSGDVNNVNFSLQAGPKREPYEQMSVVAESVVQAVSKVYGEIQYFDSLPLKVQDAEIELGVRVPSAEDLERATKLLSATGDRPLKGMPLIYARETTLLAKYPSTVKVRVQAIRIGSLGIVSSPCETFTETGLAVKKESPLPRTFTIELANGYNGYLPPPEQHRLGGYETWRARSSYLAADAEPKVRETMLKLLRAVAE
jgi:neutral ceramidase